MAGESGYYAWQQKQKDDWGRSLMGNPLRGTPGADEWAKQNGYQLQTDGTYKKMINIGGAVQISVMTPGEVANKFKSQQHAEQASALPENAPNYLAQIQKFLGPQFSDLSSAQQSLQGYGSAAEASALPENAPNYLAQIQKFLGPQFSDLSSAQQSLQGYGSAAEASRGAYSNPYEDRLVQLINNPDSISDTNAYRFRFNQGQQALERSAAAKGMLNSGNTLAALADYGQGAASQEYGNEFNRLSSAVGQRNQYNVGRMGAANQELGIRQQGVSDLGNRYNANAGTALKALTSADEIYNERKKTSLAAAGTALKALTSADEIYNERKKTSLAAAQQSGMLKSGPANGQSTW